MLTVDKKIFPSHHLYVVGVSGGPDSMFLVDNLRQAGYQMIVVHVNYQKRKESPGEEELVRAYCSLHNLSLVVRKVRKTEYSPGVNFQSWARQLRYNFFQEIARSHLTSYIAVAHHQQDHYETYLLQKNRKSLVDYWGLPNFARWGDCWVVRPLLSFTKEQILSYLDKRQINYAWDKTNQLPIYRRNLLRLQIANLTKQGKEHLLMEIQKKNQELKKIKKLVNDQKKFFLTNHFFLPLVANNFSSEIYLRLLYFWINRATAGLLQQRKKKLLNEIYKQIFISKKNNLTINLGSKWQVVKTKQQVSIIYSQAEHK